MMSRTVFRTGLAVVALACGLGIAGCGGSTPMTVTMEKPGPAVTNAPPPQP
jgi:hypothetical protein